MSAVTAVSTLMPYSVKLFIMGYAIVEILDS